VTDASKPIQIFPPSADLDEQEGLSMADTDTIDDLFVTCDML
jgi:hypothetical protein